MLKGLSLVLVFMFLFSLVVMAEKIKGEKKTFTGSLNCLACDLKIGAGANAQCKVYGHDHALKLMDGSYISFLENDYAELLIHANEGKWHNRDVTVTGIFYPKTNMIDVINFEIMDKEFGWCTDHEKMDQCHAESSH